MILFTGIVMSNISHQQRKTFFLIANRIGRENAYSVLENVTRGITSLKDPRLTFGKMRSVLEELINATDIEIKRKPKKKKYRRPLEIKKGEKVIKLITPEQRKSIERMCGKVGFDEERYHAFCERIIKKSEPATVHEAQAVMAGLKEMIRLRWKANPYH